MKTAGQILSALFDKQFVEKAQGYSNLFNSWEDITAKNGIAAAVTHSRIKELDRSILLIEIDHPGWKQILQTKQSKLLHDFRYRFPDMEIAGISLILARPDVEPDVSEQQEPSPLSASSVPTSECPELGGQVKSNETNFGIDAIKDEELKEKLKSLGQTIAEREGKK